MADKLNKIILPINITHNGDMDGEGCALLSKFFFKKKNLLDDWGKYQSLVYFESTEDYHVNDEDGTVNFYVHATDEQIDEFLDGRREQPYELVGLKFSSPVICGIPNSPDDLIGTVSKNVNNRITGIEKQISDALNRIFRSYEDDNLNLMTFHDSIDDDISISLLFIISDIYVSDDDINKILLNVSACHDINIDIQGIWHIDHHMTSPLAGKNKISSEGIWAFKINDHDSYGTVFIPNEVNICSEYYTPELYSEPLDDASLALERYGYNVNPSLIDFCNKLGFTTDMSFKRSATFHYFMLLLKMGWVSLLDRSEYAGNDLQSMAWMVYMISNYDTFEFDTKELPIPVSVPDALTILFKFYSKFGKMSDDMLSLIENCEYVYLEGEDGYDPALFTDIPVSEASVSILDILIQKREDVFEREAYNMREITPSQLCCAIGLDFGDEDLFFDNNREYKIALAGGAVNDSSYTGNTLCKKYGYDLVVMMYNERCTLSMRSNNHDAKAFDCAKFAKFLGGGGHTHASGCRLRKGAYLNLLKLFYELGDKHLVLE